MIAQMPHIQDNEDLVAIIQAMRLQEETGYQTSDYLYPLEQQQQQEQQGPKKPCHIDADCRFKMAEWCYQIVDYCSFSREAVAIAMSCLDRFLCTPAGSKAIGNRKAFRLAAMACLYTAIKVHEAEAVDPETFVELSRNCYKEEQITSMEATVLGAIEWRVNPPTALAFVQHFLAMIPSLTNKERKSLLKLSRFQTELAVNESSFLGVKASTIAIAAIANALRASAKDQKIVDMLATITETDMETDFMKEIQMTLFELLECVSEENPSEEKTPEPVTTMKQVAENGDEGHVSPRCVSESR